MQHTVLVVGSPSTERKGLMKILNHHFKEIIIHTEDDLDQILTKSCLPNDFEIEWEVIILLTLDEGYEKQKKNISAFFKLIQIIHFHGRILCFTEDEVQKIFIRENNSRTKFYSDPLDILEVIDNIGMPHPHEI